MQRDHTTEQRIIEAARKVFIQKGMHGARMQDIADAADINKALLHYYFRSKEQLFESIFDEAIGQFIPSVSHLWTSDLPLGVKVENLVGSYLEVLKKHPFLPAFILHEMNQDPDRFQKIIIKNGGLKLFRKMLTQLKRPSQGKKQKEFDAHHVLVNLLALCIFPFAAKPVITKVMGMNEKSFARFLDERKKVITQIILQTAHPTS